MNKICSQCGAVLSKGARTCIFCDSPESYPEGEDSHSTQGNLALHAKADKEWRGELNQRLQAYRARRRKAGAGEGQTELPFESHASAGPENVAVEVFPQSDEMVPGSDDFAFTVAIGRPPRKQEAVETRLLIDVSLPPNREESLPELLAESETRVCSGLFPVASIEERRGAALVDAACLAFAYGGFLALFGSLGGHFTLSKLSAAVCFFTFAFVYVQYFALFTIFGGTTPGMMVRGLQVASFSGESPTSRQYFLRALGYLLSAGTLFLGFLWAIWDEDALTWHDRLSRTYLTSPEILAESDATTAAAR
ncbi:MAG TPA: RDD family protein [Candidatus Acidoferrum sp.]|nr:RDD family protein [Candidatus Acidoferrum sp.]